MTGTIAALKAQAEWSDAPADWAALTAARLPMLRDALVVALGSGSLVVSAAGVSRSFRSIAEIKSALATVDAEILKSQRSGQPVRTIRVASDKGW